MVRARATGRQSSGRSDYRRLALPPLAQSLVPPRRGWRGGHRLELAVGRERCVYNRWQGRWRRRSVSVGPFPRLPDQFRACEDASGSTASIGRVGTRSTSGSTWPRFALLPGQRPASRRIQRVGAAADAARLAVSSRSCRRRSLLGVRQSRDRPNAGGRHARAPGGSPPRG